MSEKIRRLDITAQALVTQPDEDGRSWVVEVGIQDDGFRADIQGWGTDPLQAALQCAENAYATLLHERGVTITGRDIRDQLNLDYQTSKEAR